jgi:hypothetical protein
VPPRVLPLKAVFVGIADAEAESESRKNWDSAGRITSRRGISPWLNATPTSFCTDKRGRYIGSFSPAKRSCSFAIRGHRQ